MAAAAAPYPNLTRSSFAASTAALKWTCLARWTKTKAFLSRSKKAEDGVKPGGSFSSLAVTVDKPKPAAKAGAAVPAVVPTADSAADEEAARVMQRLYRGKLARTHVAAVKEREVMMSGKVNVKMNKDEEVTQLNDYKIGKILGQGAYGIVYKAHGPEHGDVAVKVLNRSVLSKKTQGKGTALDGVLKEIGVMKKLHHPNCVQLWEVTAPTRGLTTLPALVPPCHRHRHHLSSPPPPPPLQVINDPDHNNMYLIMEFVAGGDLSAPITRKEIISEPRMRTWMRDSVVGLEYLHSFSILHRDIKPENILWDEVAQVSSSSRPPASTATLAPSRQTPFHRRRHRHPAAAAVAIPPPPSRRRRLALLAGRQARRLRSLRHPVGWRAQGLRQGHRGHARLLRAGDVRR